MDILLLLIPLSVLLVFGIGAVLWWSVASGQFDDLEGPAHRILADDDSGEAVAPKPGPAAKSLRRGGLTSVKPGPGGSP